jgi:EAL domain-containing protein (putative c-di-GMP-specific phosphodiesterase class I)
MKQVIVKSFVQIAREFEIFILAEGLEAAEDIEFCREIGVKLGQGFGLGMPGKQPIGAMQALCLS